jgi:hypothetical protein
MGAGGELWRDEGQDVGAGELHPNQITSGSAAERNRDVWREAKGFGTKLVEGRGGVTPEHV